MFSCLNDSNTTYVGKTKRYLRKRADEHLEGNSAIYTHVSSCCDCQSSVGYHQAFSILDRADRDFDLKILEALQIKERQPTLNKQLATGGASFHLNVF